FKHCHKWAVLLKERKQKIDQASEALDSEDFETAKKLTNKVLYGDSARGKKFDPGMEGSLLYHMAMVSKMSTEHRLILEELEIDSPQVKNLFWRFYDDFTSDVKSLLKGVVDGRINWKKVLDTPTLEEKEKIKILRRLIKKSQEVTNGIFRDNSSNKNRLRELYQEWTVPIVEMRLRQEYHTLRGFLIIKELAETLGIKKLQQAMRNVQKRFGEETVNFALNVSLKVGKDKKDLQSLMLSDHYIEREMDMGKLQGKMRFLNCPVFGSHYYMTKELGMPTNIGSLFCKYFCYAHAKAMMELVLPFPFSLIHSKEMSKDGTCEFSLNLARGDESEISQEKHFPLVVSWNVTTKCNLKCPHCYINATDQKTPNELTKDAAKMLIHQIAEVSKPLLILSGGEPLLREDIFELIQYGSERGLKMGMGSNGMLIDAEVARKLKKAGMYTVAISLDSTIPEQHDKFRGVKGCWEKAVNAMKELKKNDILVQVNTTVTQKNYDQIDNIISLAERLGAENFHLFFLVPTGRGSGIDDISPTMYEEMIRHVLTENATRKLKVKPSCAPQFMRIAQQVGVDTTRWIRGCIAGLYYCRIYPTGEVTPCPYLPIPLGNIRERSFKDIWFNSEVLKALRDFDRLKGKCGICEYKDVCGGCRARAYGVSRISADPCGGLMEPSELEGDYLAEDPWCVYEPKR
ncbi:MAG: radical SAM protein, partial [Thermoproteota archaeon]